MTASEAKTLYLKSEGVLKIECQIKDDELDTWEEIKGRKPVFAPTCIYRIKE